MEVKIPRHYSGPLYFYVISHEGNLMQQSTSPEKFDEYLKRDVNSKPNPEFLYEFRGVNEEIREEVNKILSKYRPKKTIKIRKVKLRLDAWVAKLAERCEQDGIEGLLSASSIV